MPAEKQEYKSEQLKEMMSLYKHHLDLFWKWITLYVTIISAISAYIFNKEVLPATKRLFPILIAMASFGIAIGCFIMWSWIKGLQIEIKSITGDAHSNHYSSLLGIKMTIAVLITTILFGLINLFYAFYGNL